MIDRNIRQTRSKEEAKKAHWRAAGTLLCMMVLYGIITKIQSVILSCKSAETAAIPSKSRIPRSRIQAPVRRIPFKIS